jgi:hypothetical protein
MRDPIMTYIRLVEDLERIAATEQQSFDPILVNEILELKEELSEQGIVYLDLDGHSRLFRLVPEKVKP